jgi:hypothetical protein
MRKKISKLYKKCLILHVIVFLPFVNKMSYFLKNGNLKLIKFKLFESSNRHKNLKKYKRHLHPVKFKNLSEYRIKLFMTDILNRKCS